MDNRYVAHLMIEDYFYSYKLFCENINNEYLASKAAYALLLFKKMRANHFYRLKSLPKKLFFNNGRDELIAEINKLNYHIDILEKDSRLKKLEDSLCENGLRFFRNWDGQSPDVFQ